MSVSLHYRIRQRTAFRTRLTVGCLWREPQRCAHVRGQLLALSGAVEVQVRAESGSVIVLHPEGPLDLGDLLARIAQALRTEPASALTTPPHRQGCGCTTCPAEGREARGHVPGPILVLSGLYLLYLYAKRVFLALAPVAAAPARIRTRQAVREMLSDTCQRAWVLREGVEIEVDATGLQPGEVMVLRRGNVVAADGRVMGGSAFLDEAALTGEDAPVPRGVGDPVLAGTVVVDGSVQVQVERAGEATRLAAIIRLIEEAEHDPGDLQRASRRFSQAMVPVSLGLAGAALLFTGNIMQAMAVLIITCPCALRLSTSVAVSGAMSSAARRGILIKGGRYVEIAGQVDVLAVDKTGTLTDRSAEVIAVEVMDRRYHESTVLRLAASAQQAWSHPLSRALIDRAQAQSLALWPVEEPELIIGQGVRGRINGQLVLVGRAAFLQEQGVKIPQAMEAMTSGSATTVLVAGDGRLLGRIELRHRWRPGSREALQRLRRAGVRHLVLLTGDRAVDSEFDGMGDFDQVLCNQAPEAKAAWIAAWKAAHPGDVVAMVGDGINDTPAFAAADLSLAIGEGGADVTVEYADIVLQRGGLDQAAEALELGRRSLRTIRECYALALGLNGVLLMLTTFGLLSPVGGALLHNLTTVLTVANASTLARRPAALVSSQKTAQSLVIEYESL